jgi:hypothetical protein
MTLSGISVAKGGSECAAAHGVPRIAGSNLRNSHAIIMIIIIIMITLVYIRS